MELRAHSFALRANEIVVAAQIVVEEIRFVQTYFFTASSEAIFPSRM